MASSGKRNVTVWRGVRPSACPVGILSVAHQGAACDAASVHFVPTIRRTDALVDLSSVMLFERTVNMLNIELNKS